MCIRDRLYDVRFTADRRRSYSFWSFLASGLLLIGEDRIVFGLGVRFTADRRRSYSFWSFLASGSLLIGEDRIVFGHFCRQVHC